MTKLAACIPTEYFVKGTAWLQEELQKPELRAEIKDKMENYEDGRYRQCGGFTGVMIGVCPSRPEADGKFISDFAKEIGEDPFEMFFDLIVQDGGKCNAIYFTMCEEDLERIALDPHTMIGTDGLVASLDGKIREDGQASRGRSVCLSGRRTFFLWKQ